MNNKQMIFVAIGIAFFSLVFSTFKGPQPARNPSSEYSVYGHQISLHESEVVPADEPEAINLANGTMLAFFKRQYPDGKTRRGVHPKAHGCVMGKFKVSSDINNRDSIGIFKPGAEYNTLIRYSNASPQASEDDSQSDSRGMAIKVLGIDGDHVLGPQYSENSQDFTLNSSDRFFADSAANYSRFLEFGLIQTNNTKDAATKYIIDLTKSFQFATAYRVFKAFEKIRSVQVSNPIGIQYFSISAFRHGTGPQAPIVKYKTIPCQGEWQEAVDTSEKNFLKKALKNYVNNHQTCLKFMVQYRSNDSQEVEDLTKPWSDEDSPFVELARITIPQQDLVPDTQCESVVINPWNALIEHQPVGGINRMRLGSYLMSINRRKDSNHY